MIRQTLIIGFLVFSGAAVAAPTDVLNNLKSFNDQLKQQPAGGDPHANNLNTNSAMKDMGKDAVNLENLQKLGKMPKADAATAKDLYDAINNYNDKFQNLSDSDNKYNPDLDQPDAPSVPSHCEGNAKCGSCYADAQYELNKRRFNLEQLRILSRRTHDMAEAGIAVLNAGGSVGGSVAALEAAAQIRKTQEAVAAFDAQVKAKREEIMGKLKGALQKIGQCEAEFYDTPDWYDRFGFIYYQFMDTKYSG